MVVVVVVDMIWRCRRRGEEVRDKGKMGKRRRGEGGRLAGLAGCCDYLLGTGGRASTGAGGRACLLGVGVWVWVEAATPGLMKKSEC